MTHSRATIVITDAGIWAGVAIFQHRQWSLAASAFRCCEVPGAMRVDTQLDKVVQGVIEAVREINGQNAMARLVVPVSWVLMHAIDLPDRRLSRQALAFEFENFLPVPIEDLTCTFIEAGHKLASDAAPAARCLGIGIATEPMRTLLDGLNAAGIEVDCIVPTLPPRPLDVEDQNLIGDIWCDETSAVLTVIDRATTRLITLQAFRIAMDDPTTIARHVQSAVGDHEKGSISWTLAGRIDEVMTSQLANLTGGAFRLNTPWASDEPPVPLLLPISADDECNLRVGELAFSGRLGRTSQLATRCGILAALCLLIVALGSWLQQRHYDRAIAGLQAQESQIYTSVFPGKAVPMGATLRLASERRRLEGLTRLSNGVEEERIDLFAVLREVVAAIPQKTRINIVELRLDQRELTVRGTTTAHRDAEAIGNSLGKTEFLSPQPPRSDMLEDGSVTFSLRANCAMNSTLNHRPKTSKSPLTAQSVSRTSEKR